MQVSCPWAAKVTLDAVRRMVWAAQCAASRSMISETFALLRSCVGMPHCSLCAVLVVEPQVFEAVCYDYQYVRAVYNITRCDLG